MEESKLIVHTDGDERIGLNKGTGHFYCEEVVGDGWGELKDDFYTLQDAKTYLENRKKRKKAIKKKKCKPLLGIIRSYGDREYSNIKITSLADEGYGSQYAWISNSLKGTHGKEKVEHILKDNERNRAIIGDLLVYQKKIEELENLKEYFTDEEIQDYFLEGESNE